MANRFDSINSGEIVSFNKQVLDSLISTGDADAALLYLCLVENRHSNNLPWDSDRVEAARKSLVRMDLIPDGPVENIHHQTKPERVTELDSTPQRSMIYTLNDVAKALEQNDDFRNLVPAVEGKLEKILSNDELRTLYATYDSTELSSDVILKVTDCCISQRREGEQYPTITVTQICQQAKALAKGNIHLPFESTAPVSQSLPTTDRETEILSLLFNGKVRRPVKQESVYLKSWINEGFSDDLLKMAFERTIFQLHKFNWAYMNAILRNWSNADVSTPDEVEIYEDRKKESFYQSRQLNSSGIRLNPVTAEDVDRMFENID